MPADLRPQTSDPRPPTVGRLAPRLVYVLSASHSGSTLLAMLLGAQAGICTVGELKATSLGDPDRYRCSCGSMIKECGFWAQVSRAMDRHGINGFDITRAGTSVHEAASGWTRRLLAPLNRGPGLEFIRDAGLFFAPGWRLHLRETQRRNAALVGVLQEITGASVVVDSSKQALRLKYLLRNPALETQVVRVVRDGRAVSLTYMDDWNFADASASELRGGGSGARREPPRRSMLEAANEWKRSNEAADCLVDRLPASQWMQVHYEQLCAEPEPTLRRLREFLGLSADTVNLDFRARAQHVIGNGMRFDSSSEVKLDERWKNHLSAEDLKIFDRVAGDLNRHYGYD